MAPRGGAVLTLYLLDSGANVSVGGTLDIDCIESSNEPGFKLITGHKARAKGKPIYAELPAGSDSVASIEWYAEASWRYRGKATKSDGAMFLIGFSEYRSTLPAEVRRVNGQDGRIMLPVEVAALPNDRATGTCDVGGDFPRKALR